MYHVRQRRQKKESSNFFFLFLRGVKEKQTTDAIQAGGLSSSSLPIQMTYYHSLCLSVSSLMFTDKYFESCGRSTHVTELLKLLGFSYIFDKVDETGVQGSSGLLDIKTHSTGVTVIFDCGS